MSQIIAIHSSRRGVGKSMIAVNIATLLAASGQRIAVVDTDFHSPSINVLFGLDETNTTYTLNDYLYGRCAIKAAAYDVTTALDENLRGTVVVVPCGAIVGQIAGTLPDGQYTNLLSDGCHKLLSDFNLDVVLVDTDSGLNADTLPAIAMADSVLIILCHDQKDYQGTSVLVDVLNRLAAVPRIVLMINEVPVMFDFNDVKAQVAATYNCEVASVLPHSDSMAALGGSGIFALYYPKDPITASLKQAAKVVASIP